VIVEAREAVMRASLKSRSRIRGPWLQVASLDDDALGVAEWISGILRSDDALQLVADFSWAEPCVAAAVAASLTGHQVAVSAVAVGHVALLNGPTVSVRGNFATAQAGWEAIAKDHVTYPSF
jgi:hypothetical protein